MNSLGVILLFAGVLATPAILMLVRGPRGVVMGFVLPWMVLSPRAGVNLPGLPQFTKDQAVSIGILLGVLLFRSEYIRNLRPKPIDLFALMWLISSAISSMTNGLGPWDAMSEMYGRIVVWGIPYFVGRAMIRSPEDLRECAIGVILSGLIAVPLCLIEIRLSPQLHRWVYGVHASPFHMAMRLGAYRPTLMFRHGIETGTWMSCASIVAIWFAIVAGRERFAYAPARVHMIIVVAVTIMCRSLGSLVLLAGSTSVAVFTRATGLKLALIALVISTPAYVSLRVTGIWSPDVIAQIIEDHVDADRATSMRARTYQEDELGAKASQRMLFGWGGHNRFRVFDEFGERTTAVDALWLITYGKNGVFGLTGLYGMIAVPALLLVLRTPGRLLLHARMAGAVGLILAIMISAGDSLQNAFFSPLMMLATGAIATAAVSIRGWLPRQAPPRHPATNSPPTMPAGYQPPTAQTGPRMHR